MHYPRPHALLSGAVFLLLTAFITPSLAGDYTPPSPKKKLVILNWSEYLDPELVEKFEQEFNAEVSEAYFESDDLRNDMLLETNSLGYDIAVVNGITIDSYRRRGWLEPVDRAKFPNHRHLDPHWLDAFAGTREYAVPYFWGTMGIAYRSDLVETPPTSWMDLLQPAEYLRGKIGMVEAANDLMTVALKAQGYSANSTDMREIKAAEALLLKQKPYVKSYNYVALNEKSALVSGELIAALIYSGDALMVQEHNEHIEYVLPSEGANIWVDYMAVMAGSRNKDLAWAFLNFINEPENAAQLAEYVYYATPNSAAEKLLPEEFLTNPVIYPSKEALAKSEFYKPLSPRATKKRNISYARIMQ